MAEDGRGDVNATSGDSSNRPSVPLPRPSLRDVVLQARSRQLTEVPNAEGQTATAPIGRDSSAAEPYSNAQQAPPEQQRAPDGVCAISALAHSKSSLLATPSESKPPTSSFTAETLSARPRAEGSHYGSKQGAGATGAALGPVKEDKQRRVSADGSTGAKQRDKKVSLRDYNVAAGARGRSVFSFSSGAAGSDDDNPYAEKTQALPKTWYRLSCGPVTIDMKYLLWDVWGPTDPVKLAWDCSMLLVMCYIVYIVPYAVAFDIDLDDLHQPLGALDMFVLIMFFLDILMTFRTAYVDKEAQLVFDRRSIAIHYLTTWFIPDVLTSLPWSMMFKMQHISLIWLARVIRLLRLLRIFRTFRIIKTFQLTSLDVFMGGHVIRMLMFVFVAASMVHWAGCIFYLVGTLYGPDVPTWINIQENNGFLWEGAPNINWYIFSIYWALTTMTTVGYGDIVPIQIGEKIVAMVAEITGASAFGWLIGNLSSIISNMSDEDERILERKALVARFIKQRKIPRHLATRMIACTQHVVERDLHEDEAALIETLPSSLRMQLRWHLHKDVLGKIPFFRGKHPRLIMCVAPYLKMAYFVAGDVIYRQGEYGHEMYFISEGIVEIRLYDETAKTDPSVSGKLHTHTDVQDPPPPPKPRRRLRFITTGASDGPETAKPSGGRDGVRAKDDVPHLNYDGYMDSRHTHVNMHSDLASLPYQCQAVLHAGEYFGQESCLLGVLIRSATAVAVTGTELYTLSSKSAEEIVNSNPELEDELALLVANTDDQSHSASLYQSVVTPV